MEYEFAHEFESVLHCHLISKLFWMPVLWKILQVASEEENIHDKFAMALSSAEVDTCLVSVPSLNHLPG